MNLPAKPIYRFEDIEIDGSRGCVSREGREQHLRQQTFKVLLYLLEQRQRIVTKEELLKSIWHDTAVTDNALVQCIADIRKALGDDSHQPRFIRTISKVGYRFIGAAEEHNLDEANNGKTEIPSPKPVIGNVADASAVSPQSALPASMRRPFSRKLIITLICLAILGAAAGTSIITVGIIRSSGRQHADITLPQVPGKKALAVMYFENQSSNAELDWLREGLADMLITDLARSNRLTVLSRQQLHLLLERTGHTRPETIRLDDALDVARRSHAGAVVLGSFAALGDQIRIDVQLYDTESGQFLASERLIVETPAQILAQIDVLSLKLTAHLGVAPAEFGKKAGLADVMTDNLEAYRYYSLAVAKADRFENAEAIQLLQKAIEFDPKFAMAYARIGYAYAVTDFLPEKGRPYLEKAFQLSDHLTEKDKLYITAWHSIARRDYPAAIQTFRQIVAQYPFDIEAYRRLGRLLYGEEQVDEAISVIKQGLVMDPEAKELYNGLGMFYLGVEKYDQAIAMHRRYVELAPQEPNSHDSLGMSYQQSGRYDEAIAEYNKALALNPEFEPAIIHLGDLHFQQGLYAEAIKQYQRYIQVTQSDLARALGCSNIAYVYWRQGDIDRAEEAAKREMLYEKGAVWNSLVISLQRNDTAKVDRLKEKLLEALPYPQRGARHDLRSYHYFLGYLALKRHSANEAIEHFKEALRHLPPTSGVDFYEDCLANAFLELGQLEDAIDEYHRILSMNPNYPLAHYHLAEALDRKGEQEQARAEYERFLEIWKHADPGIPEVVSAKRRAQQSLPG